MNSFSKKVAALVAFATQMISVQAIVVFDFDTINNFYHSHTTLIVHTDVGNGTPNPYSYVPFSTVTPMNFEFETWYGPAFFGGGYSTSTGRVTNVTNSGAPMVYRVESTEVLLRFQNAQTDSAVTNETLINRAVFMLQSSTPSFGFGPGSSLSATLARANNFGSGDVRWVVVSGGVAYLSEKILTVNTSNVQTAVTDTDLSTANFGAWTPDVTLSTSNVTYDTPGSALGGIQMAGLYYSATSAPNRGTSNLNITRIVANFTAIPEPSTYAAFLGAGVLAFAIYRRFNAKKL